MKKVIFLLVLVILLAGCIKSFPDINGAWEVNATVEGRVLNFDMGITAEAYNFEAASTIGLIRNGRLSKGGDINFQLELDGKTYTFYGQVSSSMSGFVRLGVAGDIVGYWNAETRPTS